MTTKMRALRAFPYNKRVLKPGDVFDVEKSKHVTVLSTSVQGNKPLAEKVEDDDPKAKAPQQAEEGSGFEAQNNGSKPGVTRPEAGAEDLAPLRAEYERVTGKKPFNGWNADKLRDKMHYNRRDMRAAD